MYGPFKISKRNFKIGRLRFVFFVFPTWADGPYLGRCPNGANSPNGPFRLNLFCILCIPLTGGGQEQKVGLVER
ncbi:MAG: hypothetical protein COX43_04425 [Parcubacteria group bacterium CG23_combo_of_CG06-09_8_20_14_all_35_9]|nr:MAG: hypothetical protein COX43_04425 [Parcubacteria group bacterium CG23_combo_of_CG06-09_8_20_14_all_35_9]